MTLRLVEGSVTVPKNTGVEGFLRTLGDLLERPRLKQIVIDAKGCVTYTQLVPEEAVDPDEEPFAFRHKDLTPSEIIKRVRLKEYAAPPHAACAVLDLLGQASRRGLYPKAFVVGTDSRLFDWFEESTGLPLDVSGTLSGLPLLEDSAVPDRALVLLAVTDPNERVHESTFGFKIELGIAEFTGARDA